MKPLAIAILAAGIGLGVGLLWRPYEIHGNGPQVFRLNRVTGEVTYFVPSNPAGVTFREP